jgi:hypothetical protein
MMRKVSIGIVLSVLACVANCSLAQDGKRPAPEIRIDDVELFYRVYDAAGGRPSAEQLQRDYLDRGSEGLHQFAKVRNITGVRIADALAKNPQMYASAKRCLAVLPRVRERVGLALEKLGQLYPEARFPPVTVAVGRGRPVAVGSPVTGIQIGLEILCATDWLGADVEDRFVYVIAHEYAHVQQVREIVDNEHPTVLEGSLMEGAAELTAELIAGKPSSAHLAAFMKQGDKKIETAFLADQDKTDISGWLNNSTVDNPGQLGYGVGYRVVKAYYQRASDKRQALREILQMTDPKALLAKSGWYPGIQLQ